MYGPNWDETVFNYSSFLGFLNYPRFRSFRKIICNDKLSSWKGYTDDKQKTLRNYKFSFIIENAISYNGFISDKIFDSFYSGTVPIYLGAANIQSLIPKECYIDFREFENINKLHDFLLNIDQKRYEKFIYNIVNFIKNKNSIFTFEYFNETILNSINSLVEK